MKKLFIVLIGFTLTACGIFGPTRPGSDKIVYVDKAVPYCPAPPQVPHYAFLVDKLTAADAKTPGKVAVDYVYDMTLTRSIIQIQQMIIDEYAKTTQNFTKVQAEIDKLQSNR